MLANTSATAIGGNRKYPKIDKIIDLDSLPSTIQANRVIACLDVRSNDDGDLVVTKGDQYDVRERNHNESDGNIGR